MRKANPNYLSLNYHTDTRVKAGYPMKEYDSTKPYSWYLQQDIDHTMWSNYSAENYIASSQEYESAVADRLRCMRPIKVTRSKTAKDYKWFHKFNPEVTQQHEYSWDKGWKPVAQWQLKMPNADDVQCIVGIRILDTHAYKKKYIKNNDIPEPSKPYNCIYPFNRDQMRKVMSVVYISRQDGRLCHDTFTNWCEETKLPFPEQLKHTALENDVCMVDKPMKPSIKSNRNHHIQWSDFDRFRNAKQFAWYLPFDKWGEQGNKRVFNKPHKSSYKKPKQISTYRSRRERRAK